MEIKKELLAPDYLPVKDFPYYRVGKDGTLWRYRKWRKRDWRRLKGRTFTSPSGSKRFTLIISNRNGKRREVSIHQLVLEAFVGPCPPGMESCHLNDDATDNRIENLRWDTRKANCADAKRNGKRCYGNKHPNSKLTANLVRKLRLEHKKGISFAQLSRTYKVASLSTIKLAIKKIWWKEVI